MICFTMGFKINTSNVWPYDHKDFLLSAINHVWFINWQSLYVWVPVLLALIHAVHISANCFTLLYLSMGNISRNAVMWEHCRLVIWQKNTKNPLQDEENGSTKMQTKFQVLGLCSWALCFSWQYTETFWCKVCILINENSATLFILFLFMLKMQCQH